MTDNITLQAECECDPFEACYRLDERGDCVCIECGLPRPVLLTITEDTKCPCCFSGRRADGQPCDVCGGWGVLW